MTIILIYVSLLIAVCYNINLILIKQKNYKKSSVVIFYIQALFVLIPRIAQYASYCYQANRVNDSWFGEEVGFVPTFAKLSMGCSQAVSMFHLKITLQVASLAKMKNKDEVLRPMNEIINERMKKYYIFGYIVHAILLGAAIYLIFLLRNVA